MSIVQRWVIVDRDLRALVLRAPACGMVALLEQFDDRVMIPNFEETPMPTTFTMDQVQMWARVADKLGDPAEGHSGNEPPRLPIQILDRAYFEKRRKERFG